MKLSSYRKTMSEAIAEAQMVSDISGISITALKREARKFNIKVQAKFCLLQKSMIMAEGIARQINPKANIWQTTEPLMEEWINDNMKYDFLFEKINDKSFFSKELVEIFHKIDKVLKKILLFYE